MTTEKSNYETPANLKISILLFLTLIFLLISQTQSTLAKSNSGFTAYVQNSQINVCAGLTETYNISIINTGGEISQYSVYSENQEVSIYPDFVILSPGEKANVLVFVTPKISAYGNSQIKIYISNNKETQAISQTLNVANCFSTSLDVSRSEPEKGNLVVCGEKANFNINIKNTGMFRQNISILMNENEFVENNINSVALLPGESTDSTISVNITCNETRDLEITAVNSQNPQFFSQKKLRIVSVMENEAYRVSVAPSRIETNYGLQIKHLSVKNKGIRTANYTLKIDAPDWTFFNETLVELKPNQTKTITLFTNASSYVKKGEYLLLFKIEKDGTPNDSSDDASYPEKIIVAVTPTVSQQIKEVYGNYVIPYLFFIILGVLIIILLILIAFVLKLLKRKKTEKLRKGMLDSGFDEKAELIGSSFVKKWKRIGAGKNTVFLVGDEEIVPVTKVELLSKTDLYDVELKAERISSAKFPPASKVYEYFRFDKKNLNDSDIECISVKFRVALSWLRENRISEKNMCLARCRKKWEYFNAEFKGRDENFAYYISEINGFSSFAIVEKTRDVGGLLQNGVEIKKTAEIREIIELRKAVKAKKYEKEEKELHAFSHASKRRKEKIIIVAIFILAILLFSLLSIYSKYYNTANFNNTTNTNTANTSKAGNENNQTISQTVNNQTSDQEILNETAEAVYENQIQNQTQNFENIENFEEIDALSIDALSRQDEIDSMLEYIEKNNITDSFNYQIISKNQKLTINLNYIFKDPDNDFLKFNFTQSENLNITITDYSALIIIPKKDWYGIEKIELFADDGKTATSSGIINVIVLNREPIKELTLMEKISYYKYFILAGLLVLVPFVILAVAMVSRKRRRKSK